MINFCSLEAGNEVASILQLLLVSSAALVLGLALFYLFFLNWSLCFCLFVFCSCSCPLCCVLFAISIFRCWCLSLAGLIIHPHLLASLLAYLRACLLGCLPACLLACIQCLCYAACLFDLQVIFAPAAHAVLVFVCCDVCWFVCSSRPSAWCLCMLYESSRRKPG